MRRVLRLESRRLRAALALLLGALAASCSEVPKHTEPARGVVRGVNVALGLSVIFVVGAVGVIVAAVALDRWYKTRKELEAAPAQAPEEAEEAEPVVAGIAQGSGGVPRWLYAAYVIIPVWALFYILGNAQIRSELGPKEGAKPKPTRPAGPAFTTKISAKAVQFNLKTIKLPADQAGYKLEFDNQDVVEHNVAIAADAEFSKPIFIGEIFGGPAKRTYTFTTPAAGSYFFRCDVHPGMKGTVEVTVGTPTAAGPSASQQIKAKAIQFDRKELTVPANTAVTIEFDNQEAVPHNVAFYIDESAATVIYREEEFSGPEKVTYRFTSPAAGSYFYRCDVHPATMKGILKVV